MLLDKSCSIPQIYVVSPQGIHTFGVASNFGKYRKQDIDLSLGKGSGRFGCLSSADLFPGSLQGPVGDVINKITEVVSHTAEPSLPPSIVTSCSDQGRGHMGYKGLFPLVKACSFVFSQDESHFKAQICIDQ